MKTKDITRIAFLAAILVCVFQAFANILYLEMITFTIVLFACIFSKRDVILTCVVFALLNMLFQGITLWSCMYLLFYPIYAYIFAILKTWLLEHRFALYLLCGFASFLTGQLLDLPYLLFSGKITMIYMLLGLKTSLIQGGISFLACMFLFDSVYGRLHNLMKERGN